MEWSSHKKYSSLSQDTFHQTSYKSLTNWTLSYQSDQTFTRNRQNQS